MPAHSSLLKTIYYQPCLVQIDELAEEDLDDDNEVSTRETSVDGTSTSSDSTLRRSLKSKITWDPQLSFTASGANQQRRGAIVPPECGLGNSYGFRRILGIRLGRLSLR